MKVRKTLEAWPLRLRLGAEYDLRANEVAATAECRDTILGGEFTLDVLHRAVEYRKQFDLGGVSQVALKGRCDLSNLGASGADRRDRLDVSFGFVIEPKVTEVSGVGAHFSSTTRGPDVITEIPPQARQRRSVRAPHPSRAARRVLRQQRRRRQTHDGPG